MNRTRPVGKQKGAARKKMDWKALDIVHPDAAGIDVGGSEHWVAVSPDRDPEPVRCFGCFTADLREMARWLVEKGVRSVAMQSTGVYWMPVFEVLEQHGLLNLVRGPLGLAAGLAIVPAPGETPGHQLLHLAAGGREAYFTGDLYHHTLEFDEPERNVTWAEPVSMAASKVSLMAAAQASGAQVYFAHIEGAWRVAEGRWRPEAATPASTA